jgi:hypothetical protein
VPCQRLPFGYGGFIERSLTEASDVSTGVRHNSGGENVMQQDREVQLGISTA